MSNSALAIIPARGGSKRIPRKNIRQFEGKPIIAYSIESAIRSNCFDTVMVSTDDHEIAGIAQEHGAKVPFMRTPRSSDDYAGLDDVAVEVVNQFESQGKTFEYVCILLPTAPLLQAERINEGYKLLLEKNANVVVPVVRYSYPIQRALKIDANDLVSMVSPEFYEFRSQDLMPTYHDSGQFYWLKRSAVRPKMDFFGHNCVAMILPEREVQDIDTIEDWHLAELKLRSISLA